MKNKSNLISWGNPDMHSKMYILARYSMAERDLGHTILSVAHAASAAARNWTGDKHYEDWANNSFRKVLCLVTVEQFKKAKLYFPRSEFQVMTEMAMDGAEITMVFKPRTEWPTFFKFLRLWK